MKILKAGLAALAFVLAPALGWAQNAIQSVTTNVQSGSEVIRIELSQPLAAVPGGFSIQSPPRIAIDLPGVGNATGRSSLDVNQGNLRSVNIAQSGERTRLVLNLKQATNYTAELQGNTLLLVLSPSAASAAMPTRSEPVQFAQSRNVDQQPLQDIDFRRGEDGAGRVVVQLPTSQVGVDIRQQGQSLVVEFLRSGLPDALRRRLDVTDFGTPVQTITAFQSGDRVRMVIEPRGQWEHSAYQSDNQFVVEVRPVRPDPNRLVQGPGPGYQGERLSLNFQNIEVRSLLQVIADFTDFNVVTSDSVTGNVTLRLRDVPWDQALDIILEAKGLGMRRTGNVLWIAPKDELAAKEKADLESKAQVALLEPLRTQGFQLNYAKAEEIAKALLGQSEGITNAKPILTPRGSVIFEQRTNQIFVTDIPSKLEELQDLIAKIDTPVRQVLIEARIVEAADTFGKSLGVRLGATDLRGLRGGTPGFGVGGSSRIMPGGSYIGVGEQTVQAELTGESFIPNSYFLNLPATGQLGFNPASFALSLFSSSANRFLNLEISALEADGKGKIISSPRVITADQRKAVIQQGTELPYQTATSSGATAIQFRKATLKLEVTPQITPEGNVILDVDVTKDSVGQNTAAGFAIDTKAVQTQVLVENGGTVVIGGIYEQTDRTDISKVPFLGDLPGVGALFRQRTQSANKSELLVFLTPKIISERDSAR